MSSKQKLIELSKAVSQVLRHKPDIAGVTLDKRGWCSVDALIQGLTAAGTPITRDQLQEVVETNDKKRYSFSEDGLRIRASQGHTLTGLDLQLTKKNPPPVLYHGTGAESLAAIRKKGLLPMSRHHVHLSANVVTATNVGRRKGTPVILELDTFAMHKDGHEFWISDNGVWLTNGVPAKYLRFPP